MALLIKIVIVNPAVCSVDWSYVSFVVQFTAIRIALMCRCRRGRGGDARAGNHKWYN